MLNSFFIFSAIACHTSVFNSFISLSFSLPQHSEGAENISYTQRSSPKFNTVTNLGGSAPYWQPATFSTLFELALLHFDNQLYPLRSSSWLFFMKLSTSSLLFVVTLPYADSRVLQIFPMFPFHTLQIGFTLY